MVDCRQKHSAPFEVYLPRRLRDILETYFSYSLAGVRFVISGHPSEFGAAAYANGAEIHFLPGMFCPGTPFGRRLIGHEVAHIVQQANGLARGIGLLAHPQLESTAERHGYAVEAAFSTPSSIKPPKELRQLALSAQVAAPVQAWGIGGLDGYRLLLLRRAGLPANAQVCGGEHEILTRLAIDKVLSVLNNLRINEKDLRQGLEIGARFNDCHFFPIDYPAHQLLEHYIKKSDEFGNQCHQDDALFQMNIERPGLELSTGSLFINLPRLFKIPIPN